ncbi:unnamed protein product [Hydatigera taeniaeformis]|uniref:ELYS domain-containing protein n=1 Tax=Hydatigena taeniaeformis TaxID=6205 RepID=A0A0R3X500_HYDTA|nr:unnamed protein product [Hydatigera taeniaeformis]
MKNPIIPSPSTPPEQFSCKSGNCNWELSALTVILDEFNVKYAFTAGYNASVAVAIASLLDCPLFASDALYYIMASNPIFENDDVSGNLKYFPISGLSFSPIQPDPCENFNSSGAVCSLEGHLYNPVESLLSQLSPISCRVFGILWGDLSIPRLRLPPEAVDHDLHNKSNDNRKQIIQNATKLVQWINDVGPSKALQSVIDLIGDAELKSVVSQCIPQSISRTQMDLKEALLILQEINVNPPTSDENTCKRISAILHGKCSCQGFSSSASVGEPILDHWPARMLKAYRRGFVCPFILSSLYFEDAKVFPSDLDYVAGLPSCYLKALIVRYLTYCLMYTYEMSIGGCSHLNGAKPRVIEIHPLNSETVKLLFLTLDQIRLPEYEMDMNFIYSSFSYVPNANLPDWLNLFSLCLMIWFEQMSKETSNLEYCNPSDCPIIIAACICALTQSFNCEEPWETLLSRYEEVSEIVAETMPIYDNSNCTHNEAELPECQQGHWIMHSLMEIQNIYTEMIALSKFINALFFYNSTTDSLPDFYDQCRPLHQMIASNKLFYWIAKHLYSIPIETRKLKAIREWLPQLLTQCLEGSVAKMYIDVVTDLSNLLQHVGSAKIQLVNINQSECEASITKIISVSKNCANVRRTLESFLQSDNVEVRRNSKPKSPIPIQNQALTYTSESNDCCPTFDKSLLQAPFAQKAESSLKRAKPSEWSRRKTPVNLAGIEVNRVPCHEVIGKGSAFTTRFRRMGGGYAARLKKRVGIE